MPLPTNTITGPKRISNPGWPLARDNERRIDDLAVEIEDVGGVIPPGAVIENDVMLTQDQIRAFGTTHYELIPPTPADGDVYHILHGIILERVGAGGNATVATRGRFTFRSKRGSTVRRPVLGFHYEPNAPADVPGVTNITEDYGWDDDAYSSSDRTGAYNSLFGDNAMDQFNFDDIVAANDYIYRLTYSQANFSHFGLYAKAWGLGSSSSRGTLDAGMTGTMRFIVWYSLVDFSMIGDSA